MIYLIATITALMLAYILWSTVFRLRYDRVRSERDRTRGKFAFRSRERIRFLLGRSFPVADDKPQWEDPLVSHLAQVPVKPAANDEPARRQPAE